MEDILKDIPCSLRTMLRTEGRTEIEEWSRAVVILLMDRVVNDVEREECEEIATHLLHYLQVPDKRTAELENVKAKWKQELAQEKRQTKSDLIYRNTFVPLMLASPCSLEEASSVMLGALTTVLIGPTAVVDLALEMRLECTEACDLVIASTFFKKCLSQLLTYSSYGHDIQIEPRMVRRNATKSGNAGVMLTEPEERRKEWEKYFSELLKIIFGPMFSGKTTELIRRLKRYQIANYRCLIVKYANDVRYSTDGISTHDKQTLPAVATDKLIGINAEEYDVIGIDEGQFFNDVVRCCEALANQGKIVIVAALDGTYQRVPFGDILNLVPLAEDVIKLRAVCMNCFRDASYTKRISNEQELEVIGGADKYMAVCRECHFQNVTRNSPQKYQMSRSEGVLQDMDLNCLKMNLFGGRHA